MDGWLFMAARNARLAFRILVWSCAMILGLAGGSAGAGVISGSGTGSIKFTNFPFGPTGEVLASGTVPAFPDDLFGGIPSGPAEGFMSEAWSTSPENGAPFDVFLTHHAALGPPPSGEPFLFVPVTSSFIATLVADFSVTFTLDSAGLAATSIPAISYPVFWVGAAGEVTFDAKIAYDDDFGHLGDRTLHFAPPLGSTGLMILTGSGGLDLPALPADDHVTLSGSFTFTADAHFGPGTEIKIFGPSVPEPSTFLLMGCAGLLCLAKRHMRSRTRAPIAKGAADQA